MTISFPIDRDIGSGRPRTLPRTSLDAIDLNILLHLERDGRMSKSELADRVNLSKSACHERVRILERNKLIMSYHAKIDVRKIVCHESFLTEVKLRSHRMYDFDRFERYVAKSDHVSECYFTYVVTKVVKSNNSIPIETVMNRRRGA